MDFEIYVLMAGILSLAIGLAAEHFRYYDRYLKLVAVADLITDALEDEVLTPEELEAVHKLLKELWA